MTPEQHGWRQCARCGCHRPENTLRSVTITDDAGVRMATSEWRCVDDVVCRRLAGDVLDVVQHAGSPTLVEP